MVHIYLQFSSYPLIGATVVFLLKNSHCQNRSQLETLFVLLILARLQAKVGAQGVVAKVSAIQLYKLFKLKLTSGTHTIINIAAWR